MMDAMIDLDVLLARRAADTGIKIWIEGAFVARTPTIPLEAGLPAIVRFAARCWKRNLELQQATYTVDRALAQAEAALLNLTENGLNRDVAIALAAVQKARELL